jgi:hypothetical protein
MASAPADVALKKTVHSRWTQYLAQFAGKDKDTVEGLIGIAKVELTRSMLL